MLKIYAFHLRRGWNEKKFLVPTVLGGNAYKVDAKDICIPPQERMERERLQNSSKHKYKENR